MITILLILLFTFLVLFGAPLFVIMGGIALIGFYLSYNNDFSILSIVVGEIYKIAGNPIFMTIPLFTFAGYLMAESKTSERVVRLAKALFGWLPGGIGIITLLVCAFFTIFTGVSGVTIIAVGGLLYPILKKEGYPENFNLGILTSSGSLGLLFPPALPLIVYGIVAEINIDKLFLAGILPGILLMFFLGTYSMYNAFKIKAPRYKFDLKELGKATVGALWEIPIPIIIFVGIYSGFFTASEASAIIALYVLFIEVVIYKDLHIIKDVPRVIRESMVLVGAIFIIIGVALGLTNLCIDQKVPDIMFSLIYKFIKSKYTFLILLNIFLLIVGCLLDMFSAIMVVVAIIKPIAVQYGVDPIHLGILFISNLEIGYIMPPVGLNLFISSFRFNQPILKLYKAAIPFIIVLGLGLIIITYVPSLTLFLVGPH